MPHIVIEHTANLCGQNIIDQLVDVLHEAAVSSKYFPIGGCRTLARSIDVFRVGDASPGNSFVYINTRILPGRSAETKRAILALLSGAAERVLRPSLEAGAIGLQFELSEFDGDYTVQFNSMLPPSVPGAYKPAAVNPRVA